MLGEEQSALLIKASGVNLAAIQPSDFVALDLGYLARLLDLAALSDEAMAGEFACHSLRASSRRASVETLLHAVLPGNTVLHTHPSAILALTNRAGGCEAVTAVLGQEIAVVAYARAGLDLARAVRDTMARHPQAYALVLMHHGLVTWGAAARAAYDVTIELVSRAEAYLEKRPVRSLGTSPAPVADRERRYLGLAPVIRGVLDAGRTRRPGHPGGLARSRGRAIARRPRGQKAGLFSAADARLSDPHPQETALA